MAARAAGPPSASRPPHARCAGSAAPRSREPYPSRTETPPPPSTGSIWWQRGGSMGGHRVVAMQGAPSSSGCPGAVQTWPRTQQGGRRSPQPPRAEPRSLFSLTVLNNCQRGRGRRGGGYKYEHVTPQARTAGPCTARPHTAAFTGGPIRPPSGHAWHADPAAPSGRVRCNPLKPLPEGATPPNPPRGCPRG